MKASVARDRAAEEYCNKELNWHPEPAFQAGWDACLAHTQDQNSTLKLALRRATDALECGSPPVPALIEVLKILTDNGLEYDSDGHLVQIDTPKD